MAYTKYSLTPANNTATPPDGAPEGMLPSAVNDTMRDMMAQIRDVGDGIRDGTYTMTAAKITGGTITGVTMTASSVSATSLTDSGNLTFTGTGNRITGDFSNATVANRVAIQSSTTDGSTVVHVLPNGTSTTAAIEFNNNSTPTNSSTLQLLAGSSTTIIRSSARGTGTYLPMAFETNGTERLRITTDGDIGIGTSSPSYKLDVRGTTDTSYVQVLSTADANNTALRIGTDGTSAFINATGGSTGILQLRTYGSERMRIDSSGNVGIGTSTPSSYNSFADNLVVAGTDTGVTIASGTSNYGSIHFADGTSGADAYRGQIVYFHTNNYMSFSTDATERMRITSSGSVLVGTTSSNSDTFKFKVQAATDVCVGLASATSITGALTFNFINDGNSANVPVDFRCNGFYISNGLATGAGTNTVKFNTSTKQLTYDTSSARYKDNIRNSQYGLTDVLKLRSTQFEYKDTGRSDVGLVAEEVYPIIPELVGITEDGLADSVSYDRMVSVLVKAIQELNAKVETQAAEIALLKSK